MPLPEIGKLAPDFSLMNQDNQLVQLKKFRGNKNVVVYFYPKALTPGCTTQACGIQDTLKEFKELDVAILGVSPDATSKLTKFANKHDLQFDLLSDEDHAISEKYGVWGLKKFMGKEFMGVIRTSFIINKKGILTHVLQKFYTETHNQILLNIFRGGI